MKIVRVGVENLNSLYGRHQVDLEADLGDAPLFLIIGPTGAGKSTLLDAICLALFGQTPRLPSERQKSGSDFGLPADDSRRIMSEGTAHCRAEVDFTKTESGGPARYRAIWACQRARRKAGGNLQPAERTLERWDNGRWTLLGGGRQQKHFQEAFQQALEGFRVEDFKRSVLLAQGDFAALLQADRRERADLLERLTGTDIYQRIGQIAAQRRSAAQKALDEADIALGAVRLLGGDEVARLGAKQSALEQETRDLGALLVARRARIGWFRTSQKLGQELEQTEKLVADAGRALASAAPSSRA
jgi:exonuclease SbcC